MAFFKFLAVWWIKTASLPCQKVLSDRVTNRTEGKGWGEKQTCSYRVSGSGWELCFVHFSPAKNMQHCQVCAQTLIQDRHWSSALYWVLIFLFKGILSNKSFTTSETESCFLSIPYSCLPILSSWTRTSRHIPFLPFMLVFPRRSKHGHCTDIWRSSASTRAGSILQGSTKRETKW